MRGKIQGATLCIEMQKMIGILDSSFWSVSSRINLEAYAYDFFTRPLVCPPSVEQEIFPGASKLVYPHQQRFRVAVQDGRIATVADPVPVYHRFGPGEAAAIQLALDYHSKGQDAILLINDFRPYTEAVAHLKLRVMSVPDLAFFLAAAGTRTKEAALNDLTQLASGNTTSPRLIKYVEERIRKLP